MEKDLILTVSAPEKTFEAVVCEQVNFIAKDNAQGRNGGSVGIRGGHMPAVIALAPGDVTARKDGKELFRLRVEGGLVWVRDNKVTVLADSVQSSSETDSE